MKKYITIACIIIFSACGDADTNAEETTEEETEEATSDISSNPDYQKGLTLIAQSDCLTCHKVEEKVTGPSYKEVANKYAGSDTAVDYLAGKIITGGSGVWGTVPMTPHPQLSQDDAKQMVRYILLLKD